MLPEGKQFTHKQTDPKPDLKHCHHISKILNNHGLHDSLRIKNKHFELLKKKKWKATTLSVTAFHNFHKTENRRPDMTSLFCEMTGQVRVSKRCDCVAPPKNTVGVIFIATVHSSQHSHMVAVWDCMSSVSNILSYKHWYSRVVVLYHWENNTWNLGL